MMRAPRFWWRADPSLLAHLLRPLGLIYGAVTARRMARAGALVSVPVICVGNLVAGGAGKTPTVLALADLAASSGQRPFILSRGYGGRFAGPVRVDPASHNASDVGDEPLLMAARYPVIVARGRIAGAKAAIDAGASLILMDDGLQNPALIKDVRIAVVDGDAGIGNGLCLPAGPMRAPLAAQLPHVDVMILIGEGAPGHALADVAREAGKEVLNARIVADPAMAASLAGRKVIGFAGIGRPDKFRQTLTDIGADIMAFEPFGDHRPYTPADLARLSALASHHNATLVTTQKDASRLGNMIPNGLIVLPVTLVFDEPERMASLLNLRASSSGRA